MPFMTPWDHTETSGQVLALLHPGTGQYIYAYQIFNDAGSTDAIEFFTIMGIDDPPTPHNLIGINTMNTQNPWEDYPLITEGVAPTSTETNPSETRATWEFARWYFSRR